MPICHIYTNLSTTDTVYITLLSILLLLLLLLLLVVVVVVVVVVEVVAVVVDNETLSQFSKILH